MFGNNISLPWFPGLLSSTATGKNKELLKTPGPGKKKPASRGQFYQTRLSLVSLWDDSIGY
jgi:hypothetical protein